MAGNYNYGGNDGGNYREWMYKRFDEATGNFSKEFEAGVEEFLTFANSQPIVQSNRGKFHCPCSVCKNNKHISGRRVMSHLFSHGFMVDYYVWYKHGEELNMDIGPSYIDRTYVSENYEVGGNVAEDPYVDMVNDAFRYNVGVDDTEKRRSLFVRLKLVMVLSRPFWYDDWSAMGRLIEVAGERGAIDMGIPQMMTVEDAWKTRRRRRHRADYLNKIEDLLASQGQRRTLQADIVLWRGKGDIFKGKFSTNDTWNHIRTTSHTVSWHKGIWFTHATPKYSFCVWLATHDRLATGDRMVKWNGGATGSCVFCKNNMESRDHLFFTCRYVSEIWTSLAKGVFKNSFSINWHQTLNHVSNRKLERVEGFLVRYVFQATVYLIWRERNGRRHGEDENSTDQLIRWIDKQVRNQLSTIRQMGDKRYEEGFQQWLQLRA